MIDAVAGDDDVQFLWVLLSCDITDEQDTNCLLKEIIARSMAYNTWIFYSWNLD